MPSRVSSDLLLVGSLPLAAVESAFSLAAELFADEVFAIPDGEPGPRASWVGYERERLVRTHPDIETTRDTASPTGIPRHAYETPVFHVRDGVTELHWASWPRIDDAISSYKVFDRLRSEGVIPAGLRFQVCLPFPSSALNAFKDHFADDYPIAERGFEELVGNELRRLTEAIPHADLAIQWDLAYEVLDLEGVLAWTSEGAWERFTDPVTRLTRLIPDDVLVGYHLCYGTFPEWPMYEARDLGLLVRMANYAVENSGRVVDWLHLAGPRYLRSEDDRFFEPLAGLVNGDARVFLGIVLPIDGVEGLDRRKATASRYFSDFGVAMYCGFGRHPLMTGEETMREHQRVSSSRFEVDDGCIELPRVTLEHLTGLATARCSDPSIHSWDVPLVERSVHRSRVCRRGESRRCAARAGDIRDLFDGRPARLEHRTTLLGSRRGANAPQCHSLVVELFGHGPGT